MQYYQEITLLDTPEIGVAFLWEKVYQQIHLALVEIQDAAGQVPVGVSFPKYGESDFPLGTKLRLFATHEAQLELLNIKKWLSRLSDYVHTTNIRPVPERAQQYVVYSRQQPKTKSSLERLARRKAEREKISLDAAKASLGNLREKRVRTPYVLFTSQSSQQRFHLFIQKKPAAQPQSGGFNTYGLSLAQATVPEF